MNKRKMLKRIVQITQATEGENIFIYGLSDTGRLYYLDFDEGCWIRVEASKWVEAFDD